MLCRLEQFKCITFFFKSAIGENEQNMKVKHISKSYSAQGSFGGKHEDKQKMEEPVWFNCLKKTLLLFQVFLSVVNYSIKFTCK